MIRCKAYDVAVADLEERFPLTRVGAEGLLRDLEILGAVVQSPDTHVVYWMWGPEAVRAFVMGEGGWLDDVPF